MLGLLVGGCAPELRVPPIQPPSTLPSVLGPPGAEESEYSGRKQALASRGGALGEDVLSEMVSAGQQRGLHLDGDGRLARLAQWFAMVTQRVGGAPPLEAIDFAARHLGMIEPLPALLVTVQREGAWHPPLTSLFEHAPRNIRYNRVGVSVLPFGRVKVAGVCLASSHVDTSFVPRRVEVGNRTWFEGRLAKGYYRPELAVTFPDGSTRRAALGTGREFGTKLDFVAAGRNQIELLAVGPSGLEVLANFPVYVGVAPPPHVAMRRERPERPEVAVATLLELLNAERRRSSLLPLRIESRLSEVAQAHSADMAEQRFFGHESPTRGDPVRRARSAGLSIPQLGENVGRGPSARDLHHLLMGSPGHRANILKPEFTHVGIGVVADERGGESVLLLTQLFAAERRALSQSQFNSELLQIVNQSRNRRKAPPLELDPELERVACADAASAGSNVRKPEHSGLRAEVGMGRDPKEVAQEPALHVPSLRRVGLCATPEQATGFAARTLFIVVSAGSFPMSLPIPEHVEAVPTAPERPQP